MLQHFKLPHCESYLKMTQLPKPKRKQQGAMQTMQGRDAQLRCPVLAKSAKNFGRRPWCNLRLRVWRLLCWTAPWHICYNLAEGALKKNPSGTMNIYTNEKDLKRRTSRNHKLMTHFCFRYVANTHSCISGETAGNFSLSVAGVTGSDRTE